MPRFQVFTAFAPLGPDLVGQAHMESPLWQYTVNDIYDHPVEIGLILMQDLP